MLKISLVFATAFLVFTGSAYGQTVYKQVSDDYQKLEELILELPTGDKFGYFITKSSTRVTAFRLQGVLRLLSRSNELKKKETEEAKKLFAEVKKIEDLIGKMAEEIDTLAAAEKKGASKDKIAKLKKKADEKSIEVSEAFEDMGWLEAGKAAANTKKIEFLKNYTGKSEVAIVNSAVRSEIETFISQFKNELIPNMSDSKFSHDSMEYNFHEFRRNIRWIAIYLQSLPGIYSLTPYSLEDATETEREILEQYKGNKYAEIDSTGSPVVIDRYSFYLLAHYIGLAGDAKDVAEEHFKLLENGIDSDLDEKKFKNDMVEMMEDFVDSKITDELLESLSK